MITPRIPQTGDIVCFDADGKKHFITPDSFTAVPTGWTAVGVVANVQGSQVLIVHKTNESKKWAQYFRWKLSGSTLTDGASHTENFTANGVSVSVTWDGTLAGFASALSTALTGTDFDGHSYVVSYDSTNAVVYVLHTTYTTWKEPSMTGITFTRFTGDEIPYNSNTYALNGVGSEYKGINWSRYYEYISTATSSTFNPQTVQTSLGTYPVSKASYLGTAFDTDYCEALRAMYGEGETGYTAYLKDYMVKFPSQRGALAEAYRDGKAITYALAGQEYIEGTKEFPAIEYCAGISYDADDFRAGDWFLPSIYQIMKIWPKLTWGLSGVTEGAMDVINKSLKAIGGTKISVASLAWSSSRSYAGGAWLYYGTGSTSLNNLYNSLMCVPCALFEWNEN